MIHMPAPHRIHKDVRRRAYGHAHIETCFIWHIVWTHIIDMDKSGALRDDSGETRFAPSVGSGFRVYRV